MSGAPVVAAPDSSVAKIIFKIQQTVFPRRIRVKDLFKDYDPLRSKRVTHPQFKRALSSLNIKGLSIGEIEEVAAFFKDGPVSEDPQNAMKNYDPQNVNYGEFSACVEEVFGPTLTKIELTPTVDVPPPGAQLPPTFMPKAGDGVDIEELHAVLHKIALLAKTRGIVFKYCFQDLDRSDCTSLTVPRRGGSCTEQQFLRNFPFTGDISKAEMGVILRRYTGEIPNGQPGATINYQALHDDISELAGGIKAERCPTSIFVQRPDGTTWSGQATQVLQRITASVVERRLRLAEYFLDFDNLRKGFCTVNQLNTVFSMLKISVSTADLAELHQMFCRPEDGLFFYAAFAQLIDSAFTADELEKDPLARVGRTDGATTLPARRSQALLSMVENEAIDRIQEEIAARIKERRILLRPAFEDFDPIRRGHVTKSQFARVMATCGFTKVTGPEVELLSRRYCDLGNDREFNYMDFNYNVDPRSKAEDLAAWQSLQPAQDHRASKYFEYTGKVTPFKGKGGA